MVNSDFLGTQPVGKLLFRLAIPTVLAQLVNMLYNVVDRVYIGHMPENGDLALTGVGVCLPIIMIVTAFASLISSGGAPRASIALGQGDKEKAEKIMGNCFSAQLIISAILTAILLIWGRDILSVFGTSSNTIGYAEDYMRIYAAGTVFVQLTLGMNAFITAQGFSKMSMLTVVIGAVLNIGLDPLFIYAFGWGVKGAALATVISQGVSTAWVLLFLTGKRTGLHLRVKNMRLVPSVILPAIALGVAPFMMSASESVISVCFNSSLQQYGGDVAVGAMTILSSVMQFAMMPAQGLAQGAQPILSYNYGAGNRQRLKKTFKLLLISCLAYTVVFWLCVMTVPRAFAAMFTPDPVLLDFTEKALRIYCGGLIIFGLQIACQMALVSLGKAGCSVIVAVVRKFVLLLPLIYLVPRLVADPTTGVYLAEPIADVIAVTFTGILFFFQFRKALKNMPAEQNAQP